MKCTVFGKIWSRMMEKDNYKRQRHCILPSLGKPDMVSIVCGLQVDVASAGGRGEEISVLTGAAYARLVRTSSTVALWPDVAASRVSQVISGAASDSARARYAAS